VKIQTVATGKVTTDQFLQTLQGRGFTDDLKCLRLFGLDKAPVRVCRAECHYRHRDVKWEGYDPHLSNFVFRSLFWRTSQSQIRQPSWISTPQEDI